MIAIRLLRRADIRRILGQRNCVWVKNLETASIWKSTRIVYFFTIPETVDSDERFVLPEDWQEIDAALRKLGI